MGNFGVCRLCPKGSRPTRLFGDDVCSDHLRNPGTASGKEKQPDKLKELAEKKKTNTVWFNEQLKQSPARCENCNEIIVIPANLPPRTRVAHILAKKLFECVKTHPWNRWFGCWQCHTNFDNWPAEKVAKMKVVEVCRERLKLFINEIPEDLQRLIPKYLFPKKNE